LSFSDELLAYCSGISSLLQNIISNHHQIIAFISIPQLNQPSPQVPRNGARQQNYGNTIIALPTAVYYQCPASARLLGVHNISRYLRSIIAHVEYSIIG